MEHAPSPSANEPLLAYVRFFFTVVVGELGAFHIAGKLDDALWTQNSTSEDRAKFEAAISSMRYIGVARDGRQELQGTVLFKNALFMTSIMIDEKWKIELTNEALLLEDLPIEFGRAVDLLVRE